MKIREIMESASAGTTASGAIAVVSQPLGTVQSRNATYSDQAKYHTESTPNTPESIKRYKRNVVGRFENSIGH